MSLLLIYRLALILGLLAFLGFWFFPAAYGLFDADTQAALSMAGQGSLLTLPKPFWVGYFWLSIAAYAGLLWLKTPFLILFAIVKLTALLLGALGGLSVITGVETLLLDLSTLLAGFVIGLALFSPLRDSLFRPKTGSIA